MVHICIAISAVVSLAMLLQGQHRAVQNCVYAEIVQLVPKFLEFTACLV